MLSVCDACDSTHLNSPHPPTLPRARPTHSPSQAFMEKPPSDLIAMGQLQKNFIEFIVRPLWSVLAEFFEPLKGRVEHINDNRDKWMAVAGLHRSEREVEDGGEWTQEMAKEILLKFVEQDAADRLIQRTQSSFKIKESSLAEVGETPEAEAEAAEAEAGIETKEEDGTKV